MSESYCDKSVRCPFYRKETKNSLKCDGLISNTCNHNFETAIQKKKHKSNYCTWDYFNCHYYKQINIKHL